MKNKSKFRKIYIKRLIIRIVIFISMISIYIICPDTYEVTKGINIIKKLSPLHIIWLIWMIDMILQLCKVPNYWPLGSQKYWKDRYIPNSKKLDETIIKKQINKMNKDCIIIAIIWLIIICIIASLYITKIINYQEVIITSTAFYVCDTICVTIWCPFKTFIMHNKCCTTCRIFNWDHIMMFTPLIIIPGIWTYSLLLMSIIILIIWEISCAKYPKRFLELTNNALKCQNCTDRLCGK